MLNLKLIGSLDKPKDLHNRSGMKWYESEFRGQLDKLLDECDVALAKIGDKTHFVAAVNKLGGVCDDCSEFHLSEVEHWEFYKE